MKNKVCSMLCPVLHVQRCCFMCDKSSECKEICPETSNSLCEHLVDAPENTEQEAEPILKELHLIMKQKAELEAKEKELKDIIKRMMEESGDKAFKNNQYMNVTYVAATTSVTFDKDLFKKQYPDLYGKFNSKESQKSAYIKCEMKDGVK